MDAKSWDAIIVVEFIPGLAKKRLTRKHHLTQKHGLKMQFRFLRPHYEL